MKKDKGKKILFTAFAGLLLFAAPKEYVLHTACAPVPVYAAQNSDAGDSRLIDLDIAPGDLSPAFSPDVMEYTSSVDADVTSVSVRAVPRSSAGTIASVEGAKSLSPGVNTIKVTCSAQDFTYSVYTISLTVGSTGMQPDEEPDAAGQPQDTQTDTDTDAQPDSAQTPAQQPDSAEQPDNAKDTPDTDDNSGSNSDDKQKLSSFVGKVAKDGSVKLSGASYQLSSNFSYSSITQDIPSAFKEGSLKIRGNTYQTLCCESSGVHLVYLENTDGNGSTGFYYYDEKQKTVERFKYAGTGEQFVVFISTARAELPPSYEEAQLTLPSGKEAAAYQNTASEDMQDYYLIYGIYSDGSDGWYLYDNAQGTYMRYVRTAEMEPEAPEEEVQERTISMEKYNLLYKKYTALRNNMVKAVSVLAIALVVLIIIFTAVLLRAKDGDDSEADDAQTEHRRVSKRSKKAKKAEETVSKSSLAAGRSLGGRKAKGREKKITKSFTQEPLQEQERGYEPAGSSVRTDESIRMQRAQVTSAQQRGQAGRQAVRVTSAQQREQAAGRQRTQMASEQQGQAAGRPPVRTRTQQPDSGQGSVQEAAEKMRQSMQYSRRSPKAAPQAKEAQAQHDPMDDWDMEKETSRKSRSHKKKRSLIDEDMDIMDLNDL